MGCTGNKNIQDTQKTQESNSNKEKQIDNIKDFKISAGDAVTEKFGKINRDYVLLNPPLGKGAYGEVRKAVHKVSQQVRAVKIINKNATSKEDQERLKMEVNILKGLDHPNIIKIYEFYQDQKFFYIVTELCTGGELFDKIIEERTFGENKAAECVQQILAAVNYCHKEKIVHRDLKPENVIYESTKPNAMIKIIDFGTSISYDPDAKLTQKLGTPYYIAPEVLEKRYDEKCDVWSTGVIMYILLCGYPPFNGPNDQAIMEAVKKAKISFETEEWNYISDEAKIFLKKLLEKDVKKRYSAEDALNDTWLKNYTPKNVVDNATLQKTLANLTTFRAEKKLQEAVWIFFVNYLATKDETSELLKTFKSLDTNGDGKLSRQELIVGFQKMTTTQAEAEEKVDNIMRQVDKNNSGELDYTEWVMATINRDTMLQKQRLDVAFKMFDKDGNGTLSKDEIKEIFGNVPNVDETVWEEIMKEVDDNGDGEISYKEFKEMMCKIMN